MSDPIRIKIRHLAGIEAQLETARGAIEAALDIDEDALAALGNSVDQLKGAADDVNRVQSAVRRALTGAGATRVE